MAQNAPPAIDDTWYFRGQLMEKLPLLEDGEYLWHKVQNCKRCGAKKTVKNCLWGHPGPEAFESGEWAIMGFTKEIPESRWACTKCNWRYYHPADIPEYMLIEGEKI